MSAFQRALEGARGAEEQELAAWALPADSPGEREGPGSADEAALADCCLSAFSSSSMRFFGPAMVSFPARLRGAPFFSFRAESVVDVAPLPLEKEAGFWNVPDAACAES